MTIHHVFILFLPIIHLKKDTELQVKALLFPIFPKRSVSLAVAQSLVDWMQDGVKIQ